WSSARMSSSRDTGVQPSTPAKLTRCRPATALLCNSCPGVIDQNAAHGLGGNRQEVSPILIGDYLSAKKPDTEFVDQRGGLERMISALPLEKIRRDLSQLNMDRFRTISRELAHRRCASAQAKP